MRLIFTKLLTINTNDLITLTSIGVAKVWKVFNMKTFLTTLKTILKNANKHNLILVAL